jgi:hypothetical protein
VRTPFDRFAKDALTLLLSCAGRVSTQVESSGDTQYVDLICEPDPARLHELEPYGLLGRLVRDGPSLIEFFHAAPTIDDVLTCISKQLTMRRKRAKASSSPMPRLLVIAAGRPARALTGLGFRDDGNEAGLHALLPAWGVYVVSVGDLERRRDTLLLRLLGRGKVLSTAIDNLFALPKDGPERETLDETVLTFNRRTKRSESRAGSVEESRMNFQEYAEALRQQARERGLQKEMAPGLARAIVVVYETRFGVVPSSIRAKIESNTDETLLEVWLRAVGKRPREYVDRLFEIE